MHLYIEVYCIPVSGLAVSQMVHANISNESIFKLQPVQMNRLRDTGVDHYSDLNEVDQSNYIHKCFGFIFLKAGQRGSSITSGIRIKSCIKLH